MANPDDIRRALMNATQAYDDAVEAGDDALAAEIEPQARQLAQMYRDATSATPAGQQDGLLGRAQQFASGANEKFYAGITGAPVGLARISEDIMNLGKRGVNALAGTDFNESTYWDDYQGPGSYEYTAEAMGPGGAYERVVGSPAVLPSDDSMSRRGGEIFGETSAMVIPIGRAGNPVRAAQGGSTAAQTLPDTLAAVAARPSAAATLPAGEAALSMSSAAGVAVRMWGTGLPSFW